MCWGQTDRTAPGRLGPWKWVGRRAQGRGRRGLSPPTGADPAALGHHCILKSGFHGALRFPLPAVAGSLQMWPLLSEEEGWSPPSLCPPLQLTLSHSTGSGGGGGVLRESAVLPRPVQRGWDGEPKRWAPGSLRPSSLPQLVMPHGWGGTPGASAWLWGLLEPGHLGPPGEAGSGHRVLCVQGTCAARVGGACLGASWTPRSDSNPGRWDCSHPGGSPWLKACAVPGCPCPESCAELGCPLRQPAASVDAPLLK